MCGIFGYIGTNKKAAETILVGLKTLEYRGYDSWGVAVVNGRGIEHEKYIGKIGDARTELISSNFGIGHTRWATHGGVTSKNAHPHLDCTGTIALVHNGIVENHTKLKKKLQKNHNLKSETDSEIIVHLIEDQMRKHPFREAVRKTFQLLEGLNSIAVLSKDGTIIVAKNGSPLVLGYDLKNYFLSSDPTALLPHTKEVYFLEDGQFASIRPDGIEIYSLKSNKKVTANKQKLDWEYKMATTGKFPHFTIKEIFEQPTVLRYCAQSLEKSAIDLAEVIKRARGTFLIASGTAFHACLAAVYLFSKISRFHINTALASEFNYLEEFLTKRSLIIALSQSGETIDVVEPLTRAKKKNIKIISVVNSPGSTIYRLGDKKVLLGAGPEIGVASTKAYIAKLAFMFLTAYSLLGKTSQAKKLLLSAAFEIERILQKKNLIEIKKIAKLLSKSDHIYTIGRGLSYSTAMESALKIKEISYIHTEGLAGGELKHGTIALITKGTPCIVFAPGDETYDSIISNATEIKARGGLIVGIGPKKTEIFDYFIEVRDIKEASLISQIVPAQLLAYHLAVEKGWDPDKPRNLAKSVTVK